MNCTMKLAMNSSNMNAYFCGQAYAKLESALRLLMKAECDSKYEDIAIEAMLVATVAYESLEVNPSLVNLN